MLKHTIFCGEGLVARTNRAQDLQRELHMTDFAPAINDPPFSYLALGLEIAVESIRTA